MLIDFLVSGSDISALSGSTLMYRFIPSVTNTLLSTVALMYLSFTLKSNRNSDPTG